jgi:hypothetical protein
LFLETLRYLKAEKTVSKRIQRATWSCIYWRNSDVLAYMHYIGDSYPASFDSACREHTYSKFSFYLGKKSTLAIMNGMKTSNKPTNLQSPYRNLSWLCYELIEVPKDTLDNRILFILDF